jgi:hypothetical protein
VTTNGKHPAPDPARVPPGPVPTQFFTQIVTATDGSRWCLLSALTPLGATTYWLPPGLPGELSAMLAAAEGELGTTPGLIVPTVNVDQVLRSLTEEEER